MNQKSFDYWKMKRQNFFDPLIFRLCFILFLHDVRQYYKCSLFWLETKRKYILASLLFSAPFSLHFNAAINWCKLLRVYSDSSYRGRSLTVIVFHIAQALTHLSGRESFPHAKLYGHLWGYISDLKSGEMCLLKKMYLLQRKIGGNVHFFHTLYLVYYAVCL